MRAQSQYLRIYDSGGTTYQRWQSYYANTSVTWQGAKWLYVPFTADGLTSGISGDETSITITTAATSMVLDAFNAAMREGRLVDLSIYQFDAEIDNITPQATQTLVSGFTGQVVGGSGTLTSMTILLGTALSPVGAQVPPRVFTTNIMGQGVRT
jgi:phage-related protein